MALKVILISLCLFGAAQCSVLKTRNFQPDIRYLKLEVDGKVYKLNLKQSVRPVVEDNVPVYVYKSDEQKGRVLTELEYENRRVKGIFYNDDQHMATLLAHYDEEERQIYYDGLIAPGSDVHVVKSAPEEWWKEQDARSTEEVEKENSEESQQSGETENVKLRSAYVKGEESALLEDGLSVLKPKIVAVVDYPLYKKLGENTDDVFKYVATFFNAVSLRYSQLTSIEVEISVTGIVILQNEEDNQLVQEAKQFFGGQFTEETGFVNYDATFVLTTSDSHALQGEFPLGSICKRAYSTVYSQDDAAFGGYLHTVHNLAHLLNVPHSGYDESQQCSAEGTIMAESPQKVEELHWSDCTNNVIKEFAKTEAAKCLEHGYRYQ